MTLLATVPASVTVYLDRARLTRAGSLSLEVGAHRLEIPELPLSLDPDSLRVTAHGTARARLTGVQSHRAYYVETPSEMLRQLEEQIEALQDNLKRLDAQSEQIKHYRTLLDLLSGHTETYATALAAGESSVDNQLALFDGLRARADRLDNEMQVLVKDRREVERLIKKLQNELNQQRSARPRERITAVVEIEVLQAGDLTVELSYVVSNAGWKPIYDLRLVEETDPAVLEVGYLAQVMQQTGEAWTDCALILSTARPALSGRLPELEPWYLSPRQQVFPAVARAARFESAPQAPTQAGVLMAEVDFAMPAPVVSLEEATAEVESSGAAVTYKVPGKVTLPPDGEPHKVTVARFNLSPRLDYVSAPKLVLAVYRRARAVNASSYLFLPGDANLFVGQEFIGATRLKLTAPEGEIELTLGVDDRVRVERELKRREVDKRLIGSRRALHYAYEMTLENLLPGAIKLVLHDQLPVGRHEEIKIRLDSADPKPSGQTELNLLKWEMNLGGKEKRLVRFDFTVEYPQGMEVLGLP